MNWIIQLVSAFMAIFFFSVLVSVPKKCLVYCGLVGMVGWLFYLLGGKFTQGVFWPNFISALAIALCSHILARMKKAPVTVFFVSGILTIVPGGLIYRMAYFFIKGNTSAGFMYFFQTIEVAGAIAIAIFVMDTLFSPIRKRKENRDK